MAIGGALRNLRGKVLAIVLKPVGKDSPKEAEIWALKHGMQLTKNHQATNLTICSDSAIVLGQIAGPSLVWTMRDT